MQSREGSDLPKNAVGPQRCDVKVMNVSFGHVGCVHREIRSASCTREGPSTGRWQPRRLLIRLTTPPAIAQSPVSTWVKRRMTFPLSQWQTPVPACALAHVGRPAKNSLKSTCIRSLLCCCKAPFWNKPSSLSSLTFDWLPTICCKNTQPSLVEQTLKTSCWYFITGCCGCFVLFFFCREELSYLAR